MPVPGVLHDLRAGPSRKANCVEPVWFHQYRQKDGGRIRQKRVCEVDGHELKVEDIARGYELPGGDTVVRIDADFEGLPVPP